MAAVTHDGGQPPAARTTQLGVATTGESNTSKTITKTSIEAVARVTLAEKLEK